MFNYSQALTGCNCRLQGSMVWKEEQNNTVNKVASDYRHLRPSLQIAVIVCEKYGKTWHHTLKVNKVKPQALTRFIASHR